MPKPSKTHWHDRTLLSGPYVTLALSEEQFHRALKHCKIPRKERGTWIATPQANATAHTFHKDSDLLCVVSLQLKPGIEKASIYGLLVHEAVHVWQQFRRHIGEDAPSDEFEAYSIQAISQRLIDAYDKNQLIAHAKES